MRTIITNIVFSTALIVYFSQAYSQKKVLLSFDSTLEANSEKWKVNMHQGDKHQGFGNGNPEFGPYTTHIKTVEEQKAYKMLLASAADTVELLFSVSSVRYGTTPSPILPDGLFGLSIPVSENVYVAYSLKISGIVTTAYDSIPSPFFMEDSIPKLTSSGPSRFSHWHLVTVNDSLYTEPFTLQFGKPGKKSHESREVVYVNNAAGVRIAALKFGDIGDLSNPYHIWIRKDIDARQQHMIASLFSVMMVERSREQVYISLH